MTIPYYFDVPRQPKADPRAIVQTATARFTVLTPRLIRMEYSPGGTFDDRATLTMWHRQQPVPAFSEQRLGDDICTIQTEALTLTYSGAFSANGLTITLRQHETTWHYGLHDDANLGGTIRTLDQIAFAEQVTLEAGLLSRAGWTVVDDTASAALDDNGWLAPRRADDGYIDLYFFGYGTDYKAALGDFSAIAGAAPLVPRWALGNWWNRYWPYSENEVMTLAERFREERIPLSVFVLDMDWHITQPDNDSSGWTGYTWNNDLFPDPARLINWLHSSGLRTCLNVHPADGVWNHEAAYQAMCEAVGQDAAAGQPVPFAIHDATFTAAYFALLHHPQESIGVDFWWLDWQHDTYAALPDFDPLLWLNHLHAIDLARDDSVRPFTMSRWGGLGSHRYPIGFSGDTFTTWDALAYLPHFTATAANVNYGWWSHDIGGHFFGPQDPELYLRWVQYGVLSPVNRLHSSSNRYEERHPWGYGDEILRLVRPYMQLRHRLIPYLYTMAHRTTTIGLALCTPMYYDYPEHDAAYQCPHQYAFGDQLIAAPYVQPLDRDLNMARQVIWLPPGDWYDFFTGEPMPGDTWQARYGTLEDTVLLAKAGAVVPMTDAPPEAIPEQVTLRCFPGAAGTFTLYEDDGRSQAYEGGAFSHTRIEHGPTDGGWSFTIHAVDGVVDHLPVARRWTLELVGFGAVSEASAVVDGETFTATVDVADDGIVRVELAACAVTASCRVDLTIAQPAADDWRAHHLLRMIRALHLDTAAQLELHEQVNAILEDPTRLATAFVFLKDVQLRALLEVITRAGVDHIRLPDGRDFIRLWNPDNRDVRFIWSTWNFEQRFTAEDGVVPRAHVYEVDNDRQWKVRLSYGAMHTVTYQNEYLRYRPGSTEAWLEGGYREYVNVKYNVMKDNRTP